MQKMIFIHSLPACEFFVHDTQQQISQNDDINQQFQIAQAPPADELSLKTRVQIKIKISEGHKRLFFMDNY
jgi:hypothetical protein